MLLLLAMAPFLGLIKAVLEVLPDSSYLPLPDFIVDFWESMGHGLGVVFNAFGVSGGPALVHTAVLVMGVWASVYIVMKAAVNWKVTFFVLLLIQTLVAFV